MGRLLASTYALVERHHTAHVNMLHLCCSEFQARVARGVAGHMTEDITMATTDHGESEPHRMALGQLKAKGKKAVAPVNRTGIPVSQGMERLATRIKNSLEESVKSLSKRNKSTCCLNSYYITSYYLSVNLLSLLIA